MEATLFRIGNTEYAKANKSYVDHPPRFAGLRDFRTLAATNLAALAL